jgi:hypothetical protein
VTGGKVVRISGNQLFVGDALVASWKDNASKDCTIALSFNGNTITSGTTLNKKGVLSISVTDESGNTQKSSLTINAVNNAPEICVHKEEVDIDE